MEEKCLASELLYTKIILLVLSNVFFFFKSPKTTPTSSKTVHLRFMKYEIIKN